MLCAPLMEFFLFVLAPQMVSMKCSRVSGLTRAIGVVVSCFQALSLIRVLGAYTPEHFLCLDEPVESSDPVVQRGKEIERRTGRSTCKASQRTWREEALRAAASSVRNQTSPLALALNLSSSSAESTNSFARKAFLDASPLLVVSPR